jgi:hypothetical protein
MENQYGDQLCCWIVFQFVHSFGSLRGRPTSMRMNYSNQQPPAEYHCQFCPNKDVKLWREYNTSNPALYCANCASHHQGENISTIDKQGRHLSEQGRTDTIGGLVPAIPNEQGVGYWGYTSVPEEGISGSDSCLPPKRGKITESPVECSH